MTAPPVLRDPLAQAALDADGFVLLPGAARDDIDELRRIFDVVHQHPDAPAASQPVRPWTEDPAPGPGFENDLEGPFDWRDGLEELLAPIWARHLDALFIDHRPLVSTFLMKWPGEVSHLPLHQDPSFVDETETRAVTLWIAIDDANPELGNGPLHILPRSHLMADEYRGTNTASTFLDFLDEAWRHTVAVPVRSGDAVILDGRLVHGSPPNTSETLRLAVCTPVVARDARLVHAVGVDDHQVAVVPVVDDFYRRTSPRRLNAHPLTPPEHIGLRPRAPRPFQRHQLSDERVESG